ncbi:hypothetical protein ACFOQM_09655 [Paenibacillus sp. GCM10012307]|uniref:Uncharacterized protein n=1 Tax=Paenibacillus roseus TaxID=2798579 RepID=A0A934J713_9BACL|nr:hypothetical protein [Paenibacillus roseus]MBJ6361550.1 hypothetical protein [Paenibacillus roseus]
MTELAIYFLIFLVVVVLLTIVEYKVKGDKSTMNKKTTSHEIFAGFDNISNHVKRCYLNKYTFSSIKSDSVATLDLYYLDQQNNPIWLNVCVRNDFYEMQLLDSKIDEIESCQSIDPQIVMDWIDVKLSAATSKCEFEVFIS